MGRRTAVAAWLGLASLAIGCRSESQSSPDGGAARQVEAPPAITKESPASRAPVTSHRPAGSLPSYRTIGKESGLDFQRYDDFQGQWRILEVNGGGVALFDFDRDGRLDVF